MVGYALGTPEYLAPEQAMGKSVDARVDLWATAVVTYEMLTGRTPFEGASFPELVMKILTAAHPAPSQHVAGVPPEVDEFFARALAKEPADRFQDAPGMRAALTHAFRYADAPLLDVRGAPFDTLKSVDGSDFEDTLLD